MIPPLTQLVDASGNTWSIGSGGQVLRNGVHVGGALGIKLLWSGGAICTLGLSGVNWWRWTGSVWQRGSATQPGTTP
jgi:hypothetical protein